MNAVLRDIRVSETSNRSNDPQVAIAHAFNRLLTYRKRLAWRHGLCNGVQHLIILGYRSSNVRHLFNTGSVVRHLFYLAH